MAFNLKAATPDTSFPENGFLFGADSQAATDPSIYSHTAYLDYIKTLNTTWSGVQTLTTPVLGAATGTSLALGGATLGSNALAVTGTTLLNAGLTITQGTANASVLTSTGYSLTGSSTVSAASIAGTWNTTGVATAFSVAITNTASGTGSLLASFTTSDAGAFQFDKGGEILIGSSGTLGKRTGLAGVHGTTGGSLHFGSHNGAAYLGNTNAFGASALINNNKFATRKDMNWSWSSDFTSYGTTDTGFARNAAGVVEVNSGTAAAYRDMKLRTLFAVGNGTSGPNLNLTVSAAPTSPVDGDVWREDNTNTGLKIRINGVTKTVTVS